jgi:enoyl-CoA hydratase
MSQTRPWSTLDVLRDGFVAEVILNRPNARNAMSPDMFRELGEVFAMLDRDESVRVILLHGAGDGFSAGLDLAAAMSELGPILQGSTAGPRMQLRDLILRWQRETGAPAHNRKPVIAAVHGWCIGGGLDLIAACDIRLASADARISLRETRIAIVADVGSLQRLPRIIGDAATRELALTGRDIDAAEALRLGLISRILPDHAALLAAARATAAEIAQLAPLTVQGVKQVLNYQDGKTVEAGLEYVAAWNSAFLQSEDFAEAIAAWFEKRAPQYKGA